MIINADFLFLYLISIYYVSAVCNTKGTKYKVCLRFVYAIVFNCYRFEISLDNETAAVPFRDLITTAKDGIYLYFRTL